VTELADWARDPASYTARVLRTYLAERHRWAPGTYGRRSCVRLVRSRIARLRALRAGGMLALCGLES
jgi:hypothetical protein